jgi:MOSC domain-containing protein YiiM
MLAIYIHGPKGEDLRRAETAIILAGRGIDGDRYCRKEGAGKPDQEITLVEMEAVEALARECSMAIDPVKVRRNLLTREVPLNHLVGQVFMVGDIVLRGLRLCEPCDHLEKLTVNGIKDGLHHRGGLRAQILEGGTLRAGHIIRPRDGERPA